MDILLQDIRYAARKLLRAPGFTIIAVATLALAIGATTAVFSIIDGVLLKPLPFPRQDELVSLTTTSHGGKTGSMSGPDFIDYRDQSHTFAGMAAIDNGTVNLTASGAQPLRLDAARVGARFFEILGVNTQHGRFFTPNEDAAG